ncbi:pimeloyl-ACP methyl ester carboxylesterase [Actinoplanes campanulatus]|uniref:Pimeloyl-ACP methyl ester carboxylesterase n=1 Tax=Actinoplanes campanulatus TaxID=113559 RepID=A0A7W5AAX9_9ACTN|nr:alpha/beta hydrolase [Actinoplanes campanulatus]MBB3092927.1 pimeloyl-ACP methyl ester carboxylesterase [Actinoplanes campanulatus]GGM99960.1 proteinase [Actinoplanes campanulatus]GID33977.1 proteinase [Actinoplanes campanulatus]
MDRRSRLAVAVLAVLVTVTGCTLPSFAPEGSDQPARAESGTSVPGSAEPGTAQWRPCPEVPQDLVGRTAPGMTYQCATVQVPEDWAKPDAGKKYDISMIRIRSGKQKASERIGSLLLNPGGPGGSGVDLAVYLTFGEKLGGLPTEITDRFDIVGFDPRGINRSSPVKCIDAKDQDASFAADPDPVSQAEFDTVAALTKKIADGCTKKYGEDLSDFATEQAARDVDALRAAVGDEKLTYLGYSYGTLLGATYAQLFPQNVRALVLDGAVDPTETFTQGSEQQAKGFERAFTNFTKWCTTEPSRCPIAPDARGAVTDALAKAETSPVRGPDGRDATAGWVFLGLISSLYTESGWADLANAIDDLRTGDATGIFELADQYAEREPDGTYSNLFDANLTVNCVDNQKAPGVAEIRRLQGEWRSKYPLFGAPMAVGMLPCAYWGGGRDPYPAGEAKGAPPILVVGTTGDPATPYENTADLANMLGVGQVLTWEGEGHTAYPSTTCIKDAVDRYLLDLKMPPEGLRCPPK